MKKQIKFVFWPMVVCACWVGCEKDSTQLADGAVDGTGQLQTPDAMFESPAEVGLADVGVDPVADSELGPVVDQGPDGAKGVGPTPPAGSQLCGKGTVAAQELQQACEALDPASELATSTPKSCTAFVNQGVEYQVWCSASAVYLWIRGDSFDDPAKQNCTRAFTKPDGTQVTVTMQLFHWSSHAGPSNPVRLVGAHGKQVLNEDRLLAQWQGHGITDGEEEPWSLTAEYLESSLSFDATSGGSGIVALQLSQVDCDQIAKDDSNHLVLVVPFHWTKP